MLFKKHSMQNNNDGKPEEVSEEMNFEVLKKDYEFIAPSQHEWKQRGPFLVCLSCELQHAVYIGMEKRMVGIDQNGKPILKTVKVSHSPDQ